MMREAMNQTNKPTTAATESHGTWTSYGWDQRCRNAEQAAHIGTYALPEIRGWAAHIAGYALAERVDEGGHIAGYGRVLGDASYRAAITRTCYASP
jgi:hypothetical protein